MSDVIATHSDEASSKSSQSIRKKSKSGILSSFRFSFLACIKLFGYVAYPSKLHWISKKPQDWNDVSLILILNHTSLFEFVYGVALPFSFLRQISKRLIIPVAGKSLKSPIGRFVFNSIAAKVVPLTRKRDQSWQTFLNHVDPKDICIFMPEGRMKRPNGLDANNQPMTVRTGVFDLLQRYRGQKMVIVYSYGLHHIFPPGAKFPRIFKKVEAKLECMDVDGYLKQFESHPSQVLAVKADLEKRRDLYVSEPKRG
jgi:hypothetical protein